MADLKNKVKFDINKSIDPIPMDYTTFDALKNEFKKLNVKKHPLGFGVGDRFDLDEQ